MRKLSTDRRTKPRGKALRRRSFFSTFCRGSCISWMGTRRSTIRCSFKRLKKGRCLITRRGTLFFIIIRLREKKIDPEMLFQQARRDAKFVQAKKKDVVLLS